MKKLTETAQWDIDVMVPEDGTDRRTAASLEGAFQALTNRTRLIFRWLTGNGPGLQGKGVSDEEAGVTGTGATGGDGVHGIAGSGGAGVRGEASNTPGVLGESVSGAGVRGESQHGPGIMAVPNEDRAGLHIVPSEAHPSEAVEGDLIYLAASQSLLYRGEGAWRTLATNRPYHGRFTIASGTESYQAGSDWYEVGVSGSDILVVLNVNFGSANYAVSATATGSTPLFCTVSDFSNSSFRIKVFDADGNQRNPSSSTVSISFVVAGE